MRADYQPVDELWTSHDHDLASLADVLPFLLLRDDERPAKWLTAAFERDVASVRSRIARIVERRQIAARLGDDTSAGTSPAESRFERASRRLATDAVAVALVIRWLEIDTDARFPSWPDILRRRTAHPALATYVASDHSLWFG
jgi:hypothetical protein